MSSTITSTSLSDRNLWRCCFCKVLTSFVVRGGIFRTQAGLSETFASLKEGGLGSGVSVYRSASRSEYAAARWGAKVPAQSMNGGSEGSSVARRRKSRLFSVYTSVITVVRG